MLAHSGLIDDALQQTALKEMLGLVGSRCTYATASYATNKSKAWTLDDLAGGRAAPQEADPATMVAEQEVLQRVRVELEGLPSGQLAAATLVYLGGFTYAKVVANMLGIRTGAVKARFHRHASACATSCSRCGRTTRQTTRIQTMQRCCLRESPTYADGRRTLLGDSARS